MVVRYGESTPEGGGTYYYVHALLAVFDWSFYLGHTTPATIYYIVVVFCVLFVSQSLVAHAV